MDYSVSRNVEISIKYFNDDPDFEIQQIEKGNWIDLRAAETVEIKKGELVKIPLGVAMKLPEGYEAHVLPRSSTAKNFGILMGNSEGIIDNSYSGDNDQWAFMAYAIRDNKINYGDRICQFRIVEIQPKIKFNKVDYLDGPDRGGFGSTGTN